MDTEPDLRRPHTFVIRVAPHRGGELAGLIHDVRTGEKRRFSGVADLGAALRGMVEGTTTDKETS
jgi:hypothetical protein